MCYNADENVAFLDEAAKVGDRLQLSDMEHLILDLGLLKYSYTLIWSVLLFHNLSKYILTRINSYIYSLNCYAIEWLAIAHFVI